MVHWKSTMKNLIPPWQPLPDATSATSQHLIDEMTNDVMTEFATSAGKSVTSPRTVGSELIVDKRNPTICTAGNSKNRPQDVSSRPFERVAFDVIGPLPETFRGNKYILVVQDYFSKWAEAYPLPHQRSELIAQTLVWEWISRYGTPERIHSDQGSNFESETVQELFRVLDIRKTRTTPYHPQSDGMVERLNATIEQMLRCYVDKNQRDWDSKLSLVMSAYRSSVHSTTQNTPYYLLHGREFTLPVDLIFPNHGADRTTHSSFMRKLRGSLKSAYRDAREATNANLKLQKRCYDRKLGEKIFPVGSRVLYYSHATDPGLSRKLATLWSRPWVVKFRRGVCYDIFDKQTGKSKRVHVNDLKEFFGDDNEKTLPTSSMTNPSTKHDSSTTMERAYSTSRVFRPNRVWTSGGRYYRDEKPSTTSIVPESNNYQKHVHFEQIVDQDDDAMPAPNAWSANISGDSSTIVPADDGFISTTPSNLQPSSNETSAYTFTETSGNDVTISGSSAQRSIVFPPRRRRIPFRFGDYLDEILRS